MVILLINYICGDGWWYDCFIIGYDNIVYEDPFYCVADRSNRYRLAIKLFTWDIGTEL